MAPLWPKFKVLLPIVCLVTSIQTLGVSSALVRDGTAGFAFDVNAGIELQQSVAEKAATDVLVTNAAGVPSAMPSAAPRLGYAGQRLCHIGWCKM